MSIDLELFLKIMGWGIAMVATLVAWGYKVVSSAGDRRMASLEAYLKAAMDRQDDIYKHIHEIRVELAKGQRTEGAMERQMAEILNEMRRGRQ